MGQVCDRHPYDVFSHILRSWRILETHSKHETHTDEEVSLYHMNSLLGDARLFLSILVLSMALFGIIFVAVGIVFYSWRKYPTTPEEFMKHAQQLGKHSIIPPLWPVDGQTIERLVRYQRRMQGSSLIGMGAGFFVGALGSYGLMWYLLGVTQPPSDILWLVSFGLIGLFFAPISLGAVAGNGCALLLHNHFAARSGEIAPSAPPMRWRDIRFAWTLIPNSLALLLCASMSTLIAIGIIPESGSYVLNGTGEGGRWVYPPTWLPLIFPGAIALLVGASALFTHLLLRRAPIPAGVYLPFAVRARKYGTNRTFYALMAFPTRAIGLSLWGIAPLVSPNIYLFLGAFLAPVLYLLIVPLVDAILLWLPLPSFTPAELPAPLVLLPLPPQPPVWPVAAISGSGQEA